MITNKNQFFSINDLMPLIKETISQGKSIRFSVTGNSMFPLFANRRDSVTVSPADKIKKYDIVLHRRADGTYIMHRVIKVKGNLLTIAGDNEIQRSAMCLPRQWWQR
ncbi:MAG: S24 family peptidase [Clostridia bacterium]|nr:S24 family peptidase [Clostridia bacterium]